MDIPSIAVIVALMAALLVLGTKAVKAWNDGKKLKASIEVFIATSKKVDEAVMAAKADGKVTPEEEVEIKLLLDEAWEAALVALKDGQVVLTDLLDIKDFLEELVQGKAAPASPVVLPGALNLDTVATATINLPAGTTMIITPPRHEDCALADIENWPCQWTVIDPAFEEPVCPINCPHFTKEGGQ
jgi:hypothetical protein